MTSATPAHDFLLPRLTALITEAQAQGIAPDVAAAVLTDLVTGPQFNTAAPDPMADSAPHPALETPPEEAAVTVGERNAALEQIVTPQSFP